MIAFLTLIFGYFKCNRFSFWKTLYQQQQVQFFETFPTFFLVILIYFLDSWYNYQVFILYKKSFRLYQKFRLYKNRKSAAISHFSAANMFLLILSKIFRIKYQHDKIVYKNFSLSLKFKSFLRVLKVYIDRENKEKNNKKNPHHYSFFVC